MKWLYCALLQVGLAGILPATAQDRGDNSRGLEISGTAGITNNGISLVPSFSLEQPAAILNFNLARGKFSFEPELTFSLQEGRPWYQIYWLRYRIIDKGKFKLRTGAHPGFNFIKALNAGGNEVIQTERYLTGELVPSYELSNKVKLGVYYLLSRGFDIDTSQPLHFLTLNVVFKNLRISESLYLEITPELYYLSSFDDGEGYYLTSNFRLSKVNFPLTLSSRINQVISTQIDGKDFLWNLTLTYNFRKSVIARR